MERINQYAFYDLGAEFAELKNFPGGDAIDPRQSLFAILGCTTKVNDLIEGQPIKLVVSLKAAKDFSERLIDIKTEYYTKDGKFHLPDENSKSIPRWSWNSLTSALQTFEHVFRAEMDGSSVYAVPAHGIYSTPELVEEAHKAFPQEILDIIGEKAIKDYKSAGRCLAFNLPTAAAFHSVRAMEGVIEVYYQTFNGTPGARLNGWNDYVVELEGLQKNPKVGVKPGQRSIDQIKQMKDSDRNPIIHGRHRVDISLLEADALFSATKAAMMGMALEVKVVLDSTKSQAAPKLATLASLLSK